MIIEHSKHILPLKLCTQAYWNNVTLGSRGPVELAALASAQRAEDRQLGGVEHTREAGLEVGRVKRRQEAQRAHCKGRQRR